MIKDGLVSIFFNVRGLGPCGVILFNQSPCVMSSPLGQSRMRRLYICHDPPLFTLFLQHGRLLNGSAPYFSYNSMMRNVQVYRENHIIDTTGGGWLVRKYGLRPPTPPYLREGLARVGSFCIPVFVVGSIQRRRPARRVIASCLSRRIIVHCFRRGSGTKRPGTTPPWGYLSSLSLLTWGL